MSSSIPRGRTRAQPEDGKLARLRYSPDPQKPYGQSELALILAAERLFAQHGIAGVSLRQINEAAAQRNKSAANYHFGSKDGLVAAVLHFRMHDLNRRREALIANAGARYETLRGTVEAIVLPLSEELRPRNEGNYYIRFLQQYELYKTDNALAQSFAPAAVQAYARIEQDISYLPHKVVRERMDLITTLMISALASAERKIELNPAYREMLPTVISNVIDMLVAAITSHMSRETAATLQS